MANHNTGPGAAPFCMTITFEIAPTSPEEFDRIIRNQIEIFTKVAKSAGLIAK